MYNFYDLQTIIYNLITYLLSNQNIFKEAFDEYMLIYGARAATGQEEQQLFDARLECLLECWRTLRFTPLPSSVANLRKFIAAGSRKQQGSEWTMDTLEVSSDGKCSNGAQLPKSKYASADLKCLSESLRCVAIQSGHNTDEYLQCFLRYESFLAVCPRFDVVVDGMNFYYSEFDATLNLTDKLDMLMRQLRDTRAKHVLMVFKSHIRLRIGYLMRQLIAKYPHSRFYFTEDQLEDDYFVMYAALKSDSFIVTKDRLLNNISDISDNGGRALLEDWLFNRKICFSKSFATVTCPYSFKPVVQPMSCAPRVGDKHWFVPAFSVENPRHKEPGYLDVFYDVHKTIVTQE